jgi:hypothetical protein
VFPGIGIDLDATQLLGFDYWIWFIQRRDHEDAVGCSE